MEAFFVEELNEVVLNEDLVSDVVFIEHLEEIFFIEHQKKVFFVVDLEGGGGLLHRRFKGDFLRTRRGGIL